MARVWRRRRSLDTPRPAGRRWARLRQGGSRATKLIARVATGRRGRSVEFEARRENHVGFVPVETGVRQLPEVPVSPAVGPSRLASTSDTIPLLPGEHTPARRVKFAIANGCTVGSLLMGTLAVFLALPGDVGFGSGVLGGLLAGVTHLQVAALALLACVVLDGCDGGLARKFNVASPFGAQLDSLADLGSFGLATAVVVYQWLLAQGAAPWAAAPVCALIVVCAAVRLARFNVSPKNGHHFTGVPTTMAAAVLALSILIVPTFVSAPLLVAFVAVYALSMVTAFPYLKLARVVRLPLWVWVVPAICAMISVPLTFLAVAGGYLVSGPVLWLVRRGRGIRPAIAG